MKPIWTYYNLTLLFYEKLCASVPATPELIKPWLEARQPRVRPPGGRTMAEINEEVVSSLAATAVAEAEEGAAEEEEQRSLLVFQRVDGHLATRASTIRSHIKECARTVSAQSVGKIKGERSFATKVINGVYHDEKTYWLPILRRDGTPISEPDGIHEKPVRFRLPDGRQMSALKAFEYVNSPMLRVRLKVLGKNPGLEDLETIFAYGACHGYAGERGDGEGRYEFEIKQEDDHGKR